MDNLTIVIMAGGEGKRMNSSIPKILHLFLNEPMLIRIIKSSLKLSPNKILVITGKYDELIKSTVNGYLNDTELSKITFINQPSPLGTGHAIKCTLNALDDNSNILILNGDMPAISSDLLNDFINNSTLQLNKIMVTEIDNPIGYGRIVCFPNSNNLQAIVEHKDCTEEQKLIKQINVGIYMFSSKVLKECIPKITNDNAQNEYYLTDIVKYVNKIQIYLVPEHFKYQIYGVNTKDELKYLEELIK
jgi:UDP-N-acetylglucosamine diphosphorylase/glucosamine-1-phosphate N-acetyltransferase